MTRVISRGWRVGVAVACLLAVAACAKTDDAWESAKKTDTPDAYASFLERHPKSEYAEQARTRRDALIDERDWNTARRENTAAAYAKYLSVHSDGVWSELATRRLKALTTTETPVVAPAPTPIATPAVGSPPPVTTASAQYVQLGAFSSAPSARKGWSRLQKSFKELANRTPTIDAQPLRGSSLYRLRLRLDSEEEADLLCAVLMRGGAECIKMEP
ncbi:MAG: SPOR domain-containing protein [Gammaproteobacteria bacterium]